MYNTSNNFEAEIFKCEYVYKFQQFFIFNIYKYNSMREKENSVKIKI